MSVDVKLGSLFQFSAPILDEAQEELVWAIADPPDPIPRDDDRIYTVRDNDRLDLLAHKLLGNARYFWIIQHYNNIPYAQDLSLFENKDIRIPSKSTVERIYLRGD